MSAYTIPTYAIALVLRGKRPRRWWQGWMWWR